MLAICSLPSFPFPFLKRRALLISPAHLPPSLLISFPLPFPFLFFLPPFPYLSPHLTPGPVHLGTALGIHLPIAHHHRFNSYPSGGARSLFSVWSVLSCYPVYAVSPHLIPVFLHIAYSPSDSYLTTHTPPSRALISTRSKLLLP